MGMSKWFAATRFAFAQHYLMLMQRYMFAKSIKITPTVNVYVEVYVKIV